MGLGTLFLTEFQLDTATAGVKAVGKAFAGKPSKLTFPKIPPPKSPSVKIKSEEERAKAYLASRYRRGRSREESQVTMPGFLTPAQTQRPTLSDVLG